ncbi:MAG: response regulator [Eisenbergiella massiliensis]
MFQLLIVDDEIESLEWLVELFESCGEEIAIYTASTARKALELLQDIKFDIVLTDIQMPGMNGLELYKKIKENWSHIRIVFLTGYSNHEILYELAQDKRIRYLLKTEKPKKIVDTVIEV